MAAGKLVDKVAAMLLIVQHLCPGQNIPDAVSHGIVFIDEGWRMREGAVVVGGWEGGGYEKPHGGG